MIKVLYIFRAPTHGFSIEELFTNIIQSLPRDVTAEIIKLHSGFKIIYSIFKIYKSNARVIHITGGANYLGLLFPHKKIILNIHDINYYESNLYGFKKLIFWIFWIKLPSIFYKAIITGSFASKKQIVKHIKNNDKIIVIKNCVHYEFTYTPKVELSKPTKILHIGIDPNKNLHNVIMALKDLDVCLHVVGIVPNNILELAFKNSISITHNFNLTRSEIINYYKGSDIVSFPSLAEGFGMPILEAQAIGRPVLTSMIEPMISISGSNSCLVNPCSIESIRNGFIKLINDAEYRIGVIEAGLINITKYNRHEVAFHYRNLYFSI